MKKNKLTFVIATSFLALSAMVGCDSNEPSVESKAGVESNITTSELINPSSDGGNSQNSNGGNSNSSTSQGGGNTSQGGGTSDKTDWTDAEKATMRGALHGLVLPFVNMEATVRTNNDGSSVKIKSQQNMAEGFLASYAAKFEADPAWVGGDISSEYNVYAGNAFAYQRKVAEGGKNYYVSVMFTGLEQNPGDTSPSINKNGKFYLEALDPYVYEYPAEFIGQWLGQAFNTNIIPPAFAAEYYSLEEEGVLVGYSETNIENDYKAILERTGKFNIDANKNAQGYYVCRPTDGTYVMLFKYDAENKLMMLKVEAPKGWNNAAINAIFTKNNVTPFSLGSIDDPNITFNAIETTVSEQTSMLVSVTGVSVAEVQTYINALKALGYKVAVPNVVVESNQYFTTVNVINSQGMFTVYITYSTAENANNLQIYFNLAPNQYVVKDWPAASIARYLDAEQDTVPAFAGEAYGYHFTINNTYNNVTVILDEGQENAAKDSYIATLTNDNGYVASGYIAGQPAFKSPNSEILVAVGCNPETFPGEINILIQEYEVVVTDWPGEDISDAVEELAIFDPITDIIPALDVDEASECYVNSNYTNKFEIVIDGLAASKTEFVNEFKANGWSEDPYYGFDTTIDQYGVLVSPNKQLVAYFDTVSNDLSIYVKTYFDPYYASWPSQQISSILNKWGVSKDTLPAFSSALEVTCNEASGEQKLEIEIFVGQSVRQTALTDYCVALERIGYRYDENRGGHISDNHELLVQASIIDYGIKLTVSNVALTYKVVGYNNDDWSFANGLLMADATNPEESYEVQYSASFHAEANSKFKILDSDGGWLGAEITSYSNVNNDNFSKLEGGNIQVNVAGTVTVYLKIYEDKSKSIWLDFVADQVGGSSWPEEEINAVLEDWGVDDEIPQLSDPSISDVQYQLLESGKIFTITIVGGASLEGQYKGLLGASFRYDEQEGSYVSSSEKLIVSTHCNASDLIVVVGLVEEPKLVAWPQDDIDDIMVDEWNVTDIVPSIQDAAITAIRVEVIDEKSFTITLVGGAGLYDKYEEIVDVDYDFDLGENMWISTSGDVALNYSIVDDDLVIDVGLIREDPVEGPTYRLVGPFNNWSYNSEGFDLTKVDNPEEGYTAQYTISISANAGEVFKITDGTLWFGFDELVENEYFVSGNNSNIVAKQNGSAELTFGVLANGNKEIKIDFTPDGSVYSWAEVKESMENELPEGKEIPNLEVEGALYYVFNGPIDIVFAKDADMNAKLSAISVKLEQAGYHYSRRLMGFVNTSTGLCFNLEIYNNVISVYCSEQAYEADEGFGIIILTYDETEGRYYFSNEHIGEKNPSNESEYIVVANLQAGTTIFLYNFTAETDFAMMYIDEYSLNHNYAEYLEYNSELKALVVKKDFEARIIIKLSSGNDGVYIEFYTE